MFLMCSRENLHHCSLGEGSGGVGKVSVTHKLHSFRRGQYSTQAETGSINIYLAICGWTIPLCTYKFDCSYLHSLLGHFWTLSKNFYLEINFDIRRKGCFLKYERKFWGTCIFLYTCIHNGIINYFLSWTTWKFLSQTQMYPVNK